MIIIISNAGTITELRVSQDTIFCRTYRGLQRRIEKEGASAGLKCNVKYWGGAWELEEYFAAL